MKIRYHDVWIKIERNTWPFLLSSHILFLQNSLFDNVIPFEELESEINDIGFIDSDETWPEYLPNNLTSYLNKAKRSDVLDVQVRSYQIFLEIFSLFFTPNRCSSSTISKPKSPV